MNNRLTIKKLSLALFKPLYLSGIKYFEYDIDQLIQLILGTNGSGKSSLLRVLTPDAPDPKEFDKGGYKEITIESDKGTYVLKNEFGKNNHHSFKLNGRELNDGGTVTVFKDLVKQEFDYDAGLHKLLTGTIGFCAMSPTSRKELLYKLCDINLDYALSVFDNVKVLHRDIAGALKHITAKVDPLTLKLLSDEEITDLRKEIVKLEKVITNTLPHTNQSTESPTQFEREVKEAYALLTQLTDQLESKLGDTTPNALIEQSDEDRELLKVLETKKGIADKELSNVNKKLEEINKLIDHQNEIKEEGGLEDIEEEITLLKEKVQFLSTFPSGELGDLAVAYVDLKKAHLTLSSFDDKAGYNSSFTRDEISSNREGHRLLKAKENRLSDSISRKEEIIHHAELAKAGDVVCNECGHLNLSSQSMSVDRLERKKKELVELLTELETVKKDLSVAEELEEKMAEYESIARLLRSMAQESLACNFVFRQTPLDDIINSPYSTIHRIYNLRTDIKKAVGLGKAVERLEKLETIRDSIMVTNLSFDKGSIKYYDDKFEELVITREKIESALKTTSKRLNHVSTVLKIGRDIDLTLDNLLTSAKRFVTTSHHTINNEILQKTSSQLALFRNKLAGYDNVKRSIDELHADREQLDLKRKRCEDILIALSPNKGIIADAIASVLVKFTADVDKTISRVWEYNMSVLPYENRRSLNYKFPLSMETNNVDDISKGSKGQQDIINLAVTLNAMRYLKLTNYPLFLDEVGSSFDFTHRQNFVRLIRELTVSGDCSQIFCVNHFTSDYGGITNADVVVLNPDNVIVPDTFNVNVKIG